jgi:hypothetical protein
MTRSKKDAARLLLAERTARAWGRRTMTGGVVAR